MVRWFKIQSKKYKLNFIKGASAEVESVAKQLLKMYDEETLSKLVKLHFKTSKKIFY